MTITVDAEVDLMDYFPQILGMITRKVKKDGFKDEHISELRQAMKIPDPPELKIQNLPDKMKFEYLCKVFEKYTLEQIETLLPE